MKNRPFYVFNQYSLTNGLKSPQMQYSIYVDGVCHESMCRNLRNAISYRNSILERMPGADVRIYRYDRSGYSNYNEEILI